VLSGNVHKIYWCKCSKLSLPVVPSQCPKNEFSVIEQVVRISVSVIRCPISTSERKEQLWGTYMHSSSFIFLLASTVPPKLRLICMQSTTSHVDDNTISGSLEDVIFCPISSCLCDMWLQLPLFCRSFTSNARLSVTSFSAGA
jgi:hypothetical protein